MASLIPFISEILPMIMPASTHITTAKDLQPANPTVEGPVIRRAAVVDRCDKMCASSKLKQSITLPAHAKTAITDHCYFLSSPPVSPSPFFFIPKCHGIFPQPASKGHEM